MCQSCEMGCSHSRNIDTKQKQCTKRDGLSVTRPLTLSEAFIDRFNCDLRRC